MKFRQMVWSQIKIRFEVIPDDSMVPSRLMSGTIVQTVKVWMQRMMKIGRSVDFATRNANIKCQDRMYKKYYIKMYN